MTGALIKRKFGHRHTHTHRMPCEDEGRNWTNVAKAKKYTLKSTARVDNSTPSLPDE